MRRFLRYDQLGNQIGEISANDIIALTRHEVINGEHSLEITTFQVLSKNERIVYQDGRGIWREYVVEGVDDEHASGNRPIGTYYCTWSVQSDLSGVIVSVMPGTQTPVTAGAALTAALSAQTRWARGTVTDTATSGASMYDMSTWKALGVLVKNWGGELSTNIGVSADGVISRSVDLYSTMGDQDAKRRFDFGADLSSVKRDIADVPMYCRISPRGKGEQSGDGWGRKVTIESVNAGKDYLEYEPMVDVCKIPDGSGYIYPTLIVENGDCDTPSKLKTWAQGVLESYCTPKITYTVDVLQAAVEGVDVQGVSLGDAVQVVDRYFGDGLRLLGRVIEMAVDELNERDVKLKIGSITQGISAKFSELSAIRETVSAINGGTMSTADYLSRLLERINGEVNATGGYTYITEGEGLRTYDTAVSDPLIGSEANSVVEIKGGTIRIANSKTAQGAWEWKTVFTSGHIAANLVTAANITAGFIGSAGSGNYWNLDTGELQMAATATVGGKTVQQIANEAQAAAESAAATALTNAITAVNSDIDDLQDQIDGNITTWFYASDPSMSAPPVTAESGTTDTGWDTDAKKDMHIGDLYYNTAKGYCWRFMKSGGSYSWQRISDTDVTKALEDAAEAKDTADGKRRVFVSQPVPPYDVGDLWTQGASGDIMRCATAKLSGSYVAADWVKASKYTDDSAVTNLSESLNQQEIFNRLTNNGQTQGIYLSNGLVYINGSYIKSGTIDAGYITAGVLSVKSGSTVILSANLTSGTATIGGFTVSGSALYSGKTSLTSNTSGIYISTSGISVGSGSAYTALAGGYLRGGNAGDITGYVGFNNYWTPTGVYGTRLAGRGCIALLTNGAFGIGSYYAFGSAATITTGQSGTMKFVERIQSNSDGTITWWTSSVTFTKGLMTTVL